MFINNIDKAKEQLSFILAEHELLVELINASGKMIRCKAFGDTKSQKSGAYFLKPDFPYNYYLINYRTGESIKGNFKDLKDKNYRSSIKFEKKKMDIFIPNDNEDEYRKKAYFAYKKFQSSNGDKLAIDNHSYLVNKKIVGYGIKLDTNNELLIPGRDVEGKIWTLQSINAEGNKRYISGSKKAGMFHKVGWVKQHLSFSGVFYIAEGYATATSIFMATGEPSIVAFDSGNMINVGQEIRRKYPESNIVYCMDADYAGVYHAFKAASLTKGKVVLPMILPLGLNDFNDVHIHFGLAIVKKQILRQLPFMKLILVEAFKLLHNEISIEDIDPEFLQLAENYISSYYAIDAARKIVALNEVDQKKALSALNMKYLPLVEKELIQILATQQFKNRLEASTHFFAERIEQYIFESIIPKTILKMKEIENPKILHQQLYKINFKYASIIAKKLSE